MITNDKEIKAMLKNGSSVEELLRLFSDSVRDAQEELTKEEQAAAASKERETRIEKARTNLADALNEYYTAIGLCGKSDELRKILFEECDQIERIVNANIPSQEDILKWFM
jgi:hypothetical protein